LIINIIYSIYSRNLLNGSANGYNMSKIKKCDNQWFYFYKSDNKVKEIPLKCATQEEAEYLKVKYDRIYSEMDEDVMCEPNDNALDFINE